MRYNLFSLSKQERLRLLRLLIKKIDNSYIITRGTHEPIFSYISTMYGCKIKYVDLEDIGGLYGKGRYKQDTIWINSKETSPINLTILFCHELSHRIQDILYNKAKCNSINKWLEYEREAERLSYYIYMEYFKGSFDLCKRDFRLYRTKKDLTKLREYYKKAYLS